MWSNISHSTYIVRLGAIPYRVVVGYLSDSDCLVCLSRHARLYSERAPALTSFSAHGMERGVDYVDRC
jgi:hypothetical protein